MGDLVSVDHRRGHGHPELGGPFAVLQPLHFTAGEPIACLPALNPGEAHQPTAAGLKLRAAYQALRLP
ncbi:hypothetical protein GCM10009579_36770 [Streptomyces javensis]|uniref:Uncharacterized protein n=1 Tax=Streptomyces javensis TaxID=114698 RepID=A0ABN1X2W7_9ACTN